MSEFPPIVTMWDQYPECYDCNGPLPEHRRWKYLWTIYSRRRETIQLGPVCAACCDAALALIDAEVEGRRFSRVSVVERCVCGRPSVGALRHTSCVSCWRESRMLDRRMAEVRHISRLIKSLRGAAHDAESRRAA